MEIDERGSGPGRVVRRSGRFVWAVLAACGVVVPDAGAWAQVAGVAVQPVDLSGGSTNVAGVRTGRRAPVVSPGALNNGTSIGPSAGVSAPLAPGSSVPPLQQPEALFPTIFGIGPTLRDRGIAVLFDTRNEFDGIVSGPRQGASNAGQYGLELDIDWERLAGLTGFSTHVLTVGRYGIPISRAFGEELLPSQEIYGAGGNVVSHLVYAYGEETLAGGRIDVAAGRDPLLDDFAASPLYCNFENNLFCGNPKASSDNGGFSSYPDAGWAIHGRVRPIPSVYVQTGIYFDQANIYNYAENFRSGWTFDNSYISGETFPTEIGWEPAFGPRHLPGHYKAGFWYDNQTHPSDLYDVDDAPYVISGLQPRQVKGETAFYVLVDQMLVRNGRGDGNGLIALAGYFNNSQEVSLRQQLAEFGLIDSGFWKARPLDGFALGVGWQSVSPDVTRREELLQEIGALPQPTQGEISSAVPATGVQSHQLIVEANYSIHVFRGVTFAPDFQYYIRPNAQTNLPDAALLGFIAHVQFF